MQESHVSEFRTVKAADNENPFLSNDSAFWWKSKEMVSILRWDHKRQCLA